MQMPRHCLTPFRDAVSGFAGVGSGGSTHLRVPPRTRQFRKRPLSFEALALRLIQEIRARAAASALRKALDRKREGPSRNCVPEGPLRWSIALLRRARGADVDARARDYDRGRGAAVVCVLVLESCQEVGLGFAPGAWGRAGRVVAARAACSAAADVVRVQFWRVERPGKAAVFCLTCRHLGGRAGLRLSRIPLWREPGPLIKWVPDPAAAVPLRCQKLCDVPSSSWCLPSAGCSVAARKGLIVPLSHGACGVLRTRQHFVGAPRGGRRELPSAVSGPFHGSSGACRDRRAESHWRPAHSVCWCHRCTG